MGCAYEAVGASRQAWESLFYHRWSPRIARARPAEMGPDAGFWISTPRHGGIDTRLGGQGGAIRHGGVPQSARHVSNARAPRLPAIPRRGAGGSCGGSQRGSNLVRIWDEFGTREIEGDRRRSEEIEGDGRRSTEIDRDRPTFADLRSTSLAAWVLDPNLGWHGGAELDCTHIRQ